MSPHIALLRSVNVGKRKVLNIYPSIDTPTCAKSTRKFNEAAVELGDWLRALGHSAFFFVDLLRHAQRFFELLTRFEAASDALSASAFGDFVARQLGHLGIVIGAFQDRACRQRILFADLVLTKQADDALDLGVLPVQRTKALHVAGHGGVGQGGVQFRQAQGQAFKVVAQRGGHCTGVKQRGRTEALRAAGQAGGR